MKQVVVGIIPRKNSLGETEYLLMSSKRDFGEFSGLYYPPGGHLEDGENGKTALFREIEEELGIKINPIKELATTPGDIKNQVTYWWLCESLENGVNFVVQNIEVADIRWFSTKEIEKGDKIWPATKKFFEEYVFSVK